MTRSASAPQLTLPIPPAVALGRGDFLTSPANEHAATMALSPGRWPEGRLALAGPAGAGKSHLARIFAAEAGARVVPAVALTDDTASALAAEGAAVVEDGDAIARLADHAERQRAEAAFFHLFNLIVAARGYLLVTGRRAPAGWAIDAPDLASRLSSLAVAAIEPPDDALLSSILLKHCADRQLDPAPAAMRYLVSRMERSFAAAERLAEALDRAAFTRRRRQVSRTLAIAVLAGLKGAGEEEGAGLRPDDQGD